MSANNTNNNNEIHQEHSSIKQNTEFDPFNTDESDSTAIKNYVAQYDLEEYYEAIKEHTFRTEFLKIEPKQASALMQVYQKHPLSSEEEEALQTFETSVQERLKRFPKGCFIRLSTRSPKDAILNASWFYETLTKKLPKTKKGENEDLFIYYSAMSLSFCIHSLDQAMYLLKNSSRVFQDLRRWLEQQEKGEEFRMNLLFREYSFISPESEFRGFVSNGKLTAVSQYLDMIFFADLKKNQSKTITTIVNFFTQISSKIPLKNYVIDFGLIEKDTKQQLIIIEINPFYIKTGAALFDWSSDMELLRGHKMGPKDLPAFRIVESEKLRRGSGFFDVRQDLEEYWKKHPKIKPTMEREVKTEEVSSIPPETFQDILQYIHRTQHNRLQTELINHLCIIEEKCKYQPDKAELKRVEAYFSQFDDPVAKYWQGEVCFFYHKPQCYKAYDDSLKGGYQRAHAGLALCYEKGFGTPQISEAALFHYEQGQKHDIAECVFGLGFQLSEGPQKRRNPQRVIQLYHRAADLGSKYAHMALSALYLRGYHTIVPNPELAQFHEKKGFKSQLAEVWFEVQNNSREKLLNILCAYKWSEDSPFFICPLDILKLILQFSHLAPLKFSLMIK